MSVRIDERLIPARLAAGIGRSELAKLVRVGKAKIVAWEKGEALPNEDERARLAGVLGVGFGVPPIESANPRRTRRSLKAERPVRKGWIAPPRCSQCRRWVVLAATDCRRCDAEPPIAARASAK